MMPNPMMMGMGQGAEGSGSGGSGGPGGMMMMPNPMMAQMMANQSGSGSGSGGSDGAGPGNGMMGMMMPNPMMAQMVAAVAKEGGEPPPGMMLNPIFAQMMAAQKEGGGDGGSPNGSGSGMPGMMMPGMMGGMPGGMMPGMMMNPMMAQMMAQMGAMNPMMAQMMKAQQGQKPPANSSRSAPEAEPDTIDPDVQELGDYFNIEDRWIKRLNETMKKRQDTKQQDLDKLYEVLERARSPTGLLTVKIGEMECGQFVGKIKPDKDVERLAKKFKLDEHVVSRLTELAVRRKATKEEDLERMEQHLRYCKRPSAMATLLAGKLLEGEVEELPDLSEAEVLMEKYKLDEDARSKLREIVEKRASDKEAILVQIKKHLETSTYPSSMLCKIARPLIDGEKLPDPPERKDRPQGGERLNPVAVDRERERGGYDRDRDRRDRSRDRDRDRRDRSRDRRDRSRDRR
mmetsp:Transcript_61892/g.134105  ORF Transcript_61892/g.134105 Transcript_61892/m.134105 type:complete len:458 (-) Transcript_61892:68-1441(-)